MDLLAPSVVVTADSRATHAFLGEVARQGVPGNTLRAIAAAMRYWTAWHYARFGLALDVERTPVSLSVALTFVADHAAVDTPTGARTGMPDSTDAALVASGAKRRLGPVSYATWHQRLTLMSSAHRLLGVPCACAAPEVLELVRRAKRPASILGLMPAPGAVILRDDVRAMLATCGADAAGVRDRALLLVAFASGGRRRSEVAAMTLEDLTHHVEPAGQAAYVLRMQGGKGRAPEQFRSKPIRGEAAAALTAWLSFLSDRGIVSGPLFRAVRGKVRPYLGAALSGHAVNAIVQRRGTQAGLTYRVTAHGLRGGFLTQAHRDGVDLLDAMALTDHRDLKTVREHYLAETDALSNPAGHLMG